MKKNILIFILGVFIIPCCTRNKRERNIQYLPDMYESETYETYSDIKSNLKPVHGTISRGNNIPYELSNTNEGYELSKNNNSPLSENDYNENKAKDLYYIYCSICHGENGDGLGKLVEKDKYSGVPNYKDRNITEGSIFHVITYGKGVMGSHASQIKSKDRWQISRYVMKLKNK